nr:hypothetical protein [Escherichia coli]
MAQPQVPELLFDLLDGLGKGVGVCEILWNTSTHSGNPAIMNG